MAAVLLAEGRSILDVTRQLDLALVAAAFALVLVALLANMLSWRALLAGLGSELSMRETARVYLPAQLGKYLPGSVWPLLAQMELAKKHAVPRSRSAVAGLAALVVGLIVGAVVAASCLLLSPARDQVGVRWGLLAVPGGLLALHPAVLRWCLSLTSRAIRRETPDVRLPTPAIVRAAGWSLAMWLALGLHLWVLAGDFKSPSIDLLVLSTGTYAAAWVTGLLVVFSPAGAGAREAALVLGLTSTLGRPAALALALVSRGLTLAGDVVVALLAIAWSRRREGHRHDQP